MTSDLATLTVTNGVARLVLNRPDKRNALSRGLVDQLQEAVDHVAADDSARLLVLAANGPVFCAGMDLAEMQSRATDPDAASLWAEDARLYRRLVEALFTLDLPTLALVQGPVLAGGMGLLLACDIVLAADSAWFALPEPKRGITAAVVTPLLLHRVGPGHATPMLLSGRNTTAEEALRTGLCHELASADQLESRVEDWTGSILTGAPSALATTKQFLRRCAAPSLSAQLDAGMDVSAKARETPDAREGLQAFLEKRPPAWSRS